MKKLKLLIFIIFFCFHSIDKAISFEIIRDVELENFTKKIVDSLLSDSEINHNEINYYFIKSKEINAFVTSGNNLFINTFIINIIGSFLIGYLIVLLENKSFSQDFLKYFFIIGILGSFTTFSAFSLETIELLINKRFLIAFFYIFLSLFLCLLFTYIGLNFNKLIN